MGEYWTVGEFAKRAGVTVRTIQYYDQQGLLAPSAKDEHNRRLYTEEDLHDLHRILALKHLGQSLAQIKDLCARGFAIEPDEICNLIDGRIESVENEVQYLLTQLAVLRDAKRKVKRDGVADWDALSEELECGHVGESLSWRLSYVVGNYDDEAKKEHPSEHKRDVAQWHELISEVITLIASNVPTTDERARAAAERYRELMETNGSPLSNGFVLMGNVENGPHGNETFEKLQRSVIDYLEEAAAGQDQE